MDRLQLVPVRGAGPPIALGDDRVVVGRSSSCGIRLAHESVSRRHAAFAWVFGRWLLVDLDSRHGTEVNGRLLSAREPVALFAGDLVRVGPFVYRVAGTEGSGASRVTLRDTEGGARVETITRSKTRSVARQRLDVLVEAARDFGDAADERSVLGVLARAARDGTGALRVAVLRPEPEPEPESGSESESGSGSGSGSETDPGPESRSGAGAGASVLVWLAPAGEHASEAAFARGLVERGSRGEASALIARGASGSRPGSGLGSGLASGVASGVGEDADEAEGFASGIDTGAASALCWPLMLGDEVGALLYLDARGGESRVQSDAPAFGDALAGLASGAVSAVRRVRAGRAGSRLGMEDPPGPLEHRGDAGDPRLAMVTERGCLAAGVSRLWALPDDRVAAYMARVSGGVSVGHLREACGRLEARLELGEDPAESVRRVEAFVRERTGPRESLGLRAALVDRATGRFALAGAWRDRCAVIDASGNAVELGGAGPAGAGGPGPGPAGSVSGTLGPGERLVLVSETVAGVLDAEGRAFGMDGVGGAMAGVEDAEEAVRAVMDASGSFGDPRGMLDGRDVICIGAR